MKPDWIKLTQSAYDASTTWFDANYRNQIEYGLRAFNNEHAPGSKYLSDEFKARSRIFRPKTRSIIRKNEAAAHVALFSNMEVVNVGAQNPEDALAVAGAEVMKALVDYRLTRTIPWFQIAMGALQDAQTQGPVVSYQYWDYLSRDDEDEGRTILKDEPCIELRPIENIRYDPAAKWHDVVGTSPYWIDIIPMHVCDVVTMMETDDSRTGQPKWKKYKTEELAQAKPESIDSTRQIRQGQKSSDPYGLHDSGEVDDFDIVWVMRVFIRRGSEDYTYYTLGTEKLLTDPKPTREVYHAFGGKRPYVMGCAIIETHKANKNGVAALSRPLQQEANDIANQRLDNVKLVLNKRWIVARGRQVDVPSLNRNVPGGVTFATDPNMDVKEVSWPDVTSSAYAEQDRLNADFDELVGNFSGGSVMTNRALNETVGGMKLLNQGANMMTEYLLRTWIETWVEPVLRQMMLLEQAYETDDVVLGIAGRKAQLFQRFGMSQVVDTLLNKELTLTVNVGMGATNPDARFQKFMMASQAAVGLVNSAPPGMNVQEAIKEIYSHAGYRDGSRFFSDQADPRLLKAMQIIQRLQQQLQSKQMEISASAQVKMAGIQADKAAKDADTQVNAARIAGDIRIREAELQLEQMRLALEKLKIEIDAEDKDQERSAQVAQIAAKIEESERKLDQERSRMLMEANEQQDRMAREGEAHAAEMGNKATAESNEGRLAEVANGVSVAMAEIAKSITSLKDEVSREKESRQAEMEQLTANMGGAMQAIVSQLRAKPKVRNLKLVRGPDGKAEAFEPQYE